MRTPLALLLLVSVAVACSKGGDKGDKGDKGTSGSGAAGTPGAPEGPAGASVKGSLTLGGALTATISWKPDLALTCDCINDKEWSIDATYSDGADTFVALKLITVTGAKDGMTMTSGKLSTPEPLYSPPGTGFTGSCKEDHRDFHGVISVDVDGKVTGKAGEVTVKGHLDATCR